jgi:hypothetical protein
VAAGGGVVVSSSGVLVSEVVGIEGVAGAVSIVVSPPGSVESANPSTFEHSDGSSLRSGYRLSESRDVVVDPRPDQFSSHPTLTSCNVFGLARTRNGVGPRQSTSWGSSVILSGAICFEISSSGSGIPETLSMSSANAKMISISPFSLRAAQPSVSAGSVISLGPPRPGMPPEQPAKPTDPVATPPRAACRDSDIVDGFLI